MARGKEFEVTEVGAFAPGLRPLGELIAGDVGYIAASIKSVGDTMAGDTITGAERPARGPAGIQAHPVHGVLRDLSADADLENLRDALEKLKLNDAALVFEPETSRALGFGFRCGFLGLLHMEVIQERLEREFDLDLVTTAPSVVYRVYTLDGERIELDNPTNLPDPSSIEYIEEPVVKANVMAPKDYTGAIMELCQEKRGEFIDMEYVDSSRVDIHYIMPLNEIIFDFFDQLKSRTRGYASFDYEMNGYKRSEMVKLDFLLNGDICDALSTIVHKDRVYPRGRAVAEKLKDVIPRQQFEIPIQAAIGGKVIARETVKAVRKDVLAKCYGGDISRKRSCWKSRRKARSACAR